MPIDASATSGWKGIDSGFSGFSVNFEMRKSSSSDITPKDLASSSETSIQPTVKSAPAFYNCNASLVHPLAGFTTQIDTALLKVSFMDTSQVNILSRLWKFGDGDTSTAINPVHIYANATPYNVTLIVTSCTGTDSIHKTIVFGLGLDNQAIMNDIKVFPNPASDYLSFESGSEINEDSDLKIYNIFGQEVLNYHLNTGTKSQKISIINFTSGVYFYKILTTDGIQACGKFVKD